MAKIKKPIVLILDVDGVMTTGQLGYTESGKTMKIFGQGQTIGIVQHTLKKEMA